MERNEVVSLHIGQAGVNFGNECWELFSVEHRLGRDGISMKREVDVNELNDPLEEENFFQPTMEGKNHPRCLFLDTDPSSFDEIKLGDFRYFYSPDSFISGKEVTSGPYAVGYLSNSKVVEQAMERIRKLAENCEKQSGFLLFSCIGGGTGSGLTSRILEKLNEEYEKIPKFGITILPFHKKLQNISPLVETYNCMLSIPHLQERNQGTLLFSDDKVHDICQHQLNIETPKLSQMNEIMSQSVSLLTNSMRFDGSLNVNIPEVVGNLVPFPNISFLVSSISPLLPNFPRSSEFYREPLPTRQLTIELFKKYTFLADIEPRGNGSKYMGVCACYRGDIFPKDVTFSTVKTDRSIRFVDWSPCGVKCGIQYRLPIVKNEKTSVILKVRRSTSLFSNTTAVKGEFRRIYSRFKKMYALKSYVHLYTQQGMEIEDFDNAAEKLKTLLLDYNELEEDSLEGEEDDEEGEIDDEEDF